MGLLDRAMNLSSNRQVGEGAIDGTLMPRTENSFGRSPRDIINSFQEHIGFTSASIMLLDSGGEEYYPLVSTGTFFSALGEPIIKSNLPALRVDESKQITILKFEDFIPGLAGDKSDEEVMVLKIGIGNPSSAVLLAVGYQLFTGNDHSMKAEIRQLVSSLRDELERYRQIREKKRETAFSKRLMDAGINKAAAVFLSMSDAIEAISKSYPELDTHSVTQRAKVLLERITGRMGKLYNLEGERVLIIFPDERLPDHELYLHQLSASFGLVYKKLKRTLDFRAEFKLWPNDKTYIEKQLPS